MKKEERSNFNLQVLAPAVEKMELFADRNCFCLQGVFYSYRDFADVVSRIRWALKEVEDTYIGLVAQDDLYTYASIFALWLEGKCYVPLHPSQPRERCVDILSQVGIRTLLDSSESTRYEGYRVIRTKQLPVAETCLTLKEGVSDNEPACILFTSGSTGHPKGVTLTRTNVAASADAFRDAGIRITETDQVLQMFELTFVLSIQCYLIPLLSGACVYTVSSTGVKYMRVFEVLDAHPITVSLMVPSVVRYLRPYFAEIHCPALKHSLFCGEALPLDLVEEWSQCVPEASVYNLYGSTEFTGVCICSAYKREGGNQSNDSIWSVGKPLKGLGVQIVDVGGKVLPAGEKGELCLSGVRLTAGYWNNPLRNKEVFFDREGVRYYRTGDLCAMDTEGDLMYLGRIDFQIKIQGYRIEPGEIEHHARCFLNAATVVLAYEDRQGQASIALFVEQERIDNQALLTYLRGKIPAYMVPTKICCQTPFPLNTNGKVDRNVLKLLLKK